MIQASAFRHRILESAFGLATYGLPSLAATLDFVQLLFRVS